MTRENGFALMVALVALVAFTTLATGGIWMAQNGFQSSQAFGHAQRAFNTADAALQRFVGTHGAGPPSSVTYTDFGAGEEATVTATLTRRDPDVYHVQSTATVEVGGDVASTRTVGTVVEVDMGPLPPPPSNMYSPNGIEKNGAAGTISGFDQFDPNNPGQCPNGQTDDQNGVTVSDSAGYNQDNGALVPEGSPRDTAIRDRSQMLDDLNLDWQSVVDGESIQPDVTVDPDDMSNWPNFDTIPASEWPVIYAEGKDKTLTLDSGYSGHGLIIARGDLTMNGSFTWNGLMYVGGQVTAGNGNQEVTGAMFSGLNELIGEDVADENLLNGQKTFQYHSCKVQQARGATSRLRRVPGTWYQGGA